VLEFGTRFILPSFGRANVAVGYDADNWNFMVYSDKIFNDFSETSPGNTPLNYQTIDAFFDGSNPNPANVRRFRTNVLPPRSIGARFRYRFE